MATVGIHNLQSSSSSRPRIHASLNPPSNFRPQSIYLRQVANKIKVEELMLRQHNAATITTIRSAADRRDNDSVAKLLAIAEAVADRANMHSIIGAQRNNWNHLLTNSINSIALIGSLMAGLSAVPVDAAIPQLSALKISSMLLFGVATGMMVIVNKIQPSQLAEEQRKATWMWKQLERSIQDGLSLRAPAEADVAEAMSKVLALEKAYPLPLLPGMLDKFPKTVEPSRWWPEPPCPREKEAHPARETMDKNGWSKELEEELEGLLKVLKVKDEGQYVKLGKVILRFNRALATAGPAFGGLALTGSALIGTSALGALPVLLAVVGGSLAAVVNTLEHAGQVGMLFELLRNNAGFYKWLQEEIEMNLREEDVEKRENGELLKLKLALQLGRSTSEFQDFAEYASPSCKEEDVDGFKGFAGKLF
ncbi:probable F-box protein At4g22030 [Zingiber officinale]|uniref:F-box protein n=1 Tax=Zingiber officinale TaxID=94328 RepID=A0A8J5FZG9_ZINOF|nr:probable F-box protein At4g22030 [Zingiber officinale]KAG6493272.1 hypothetical protein ZIOFF_048250 [Zingiber officinale]